MKSVQSNRRKFIRDTAATTAGMVMLSALPSVSRASVESIVSEKDTKIRASKAGDLQAPKIRFSVIGINHNHIYGMAEAVKRGGGELVSLYAREPDLVQDFVKRYPQVKVAGSEKEILEDKSIQVVLSAGIPEDRAPLGIRVMQHGKDYLSDKPGITSLSQLDEVRRVQKLTKRIYSIMYSERFENKATVKAGELVKAGAIGKVIQTVILAPHRMSSSTRPPWFFDKKTYGGIITDIGSHQFDQYLFFTGTTKATVVASQVGNVNHPEYPKFEDFGDVMLRGNGGSGYIRIDWFTPDGLASWGDGRLTILGTEGYIEVRKNVDIASHAGGNHLYLVNQKETKYMDCNNEPLPFGEQFVNDVINRTETAMSQEHCLYATELALRAQKQAQPVKMPGTNKT